MSSTLDLNGATVTLTANTTYTYYQITDTSVGHNGKLIMEAGSILRFDNKSGAGFASAATLIEIYCNGTATANCAIISADPSPVNLWSTPPTTCLIDADYTEFVSYTGSTYADYWAFNNCLWAGSRYCSVEDLKDFSGSGVQRIILGKCIELATQEINERLLFSGVSGAGGSGVIREICLKLAAGILLDRYRMDGTKPEMIQIGEISMRDGVDNALHLLRNEGHELLNKYIRNHGSYHKGRYYIRVTGRSYR